MKTLQFVAFLSFALSACASVRPNPPAAPHSTPSAASAVPSATPTKPAEPERLTELAPEERPELREHFARERVTGTFAFFDSAQGKLICSDIAHCKTGYLPASTFKIANSIIALENGIIEDAETKLPWDGKYSRLPEWNQDHTVRSAMRVSCVPCYQAIARKIGDPRMSEWLKRLDYGNHSTEGGIDAFWLIGGLRITPIQQLDFLRRFDRGKLPISERTRDIVSDIITLDVSETHVLRAKTGLAHDKNDKLQAAWFVGFVERGDRRVYFATLIDTAEPGVEIIPLRRRLTETILRSLGLLPT